jgi:two-component system, LytTR family, response regulator
MLNALIVDDEALARTRLRKMLTDRVHVVGEAGDGEEALVRLSEHEIDVLFLDIQMPELNGFEVLERIDPDNRPVVIFTTAYDSYALKAFEQNAIDYLLKPISRDRLEDAVRRVEKLKAKPESRVNFDERLGRLLDWLDNDGAPAPNLDTGREVLRQISVPYRDRILLVPVDHLISAEIHDGITRLYVLDEVGAGGKQRLKQHVVNYTLDELESKLDDDVFMRVHRSAIVQVDQIRELIPWFSGRYKLMMIGEHEVIASRDRSRVLKDRLML